MSGYNANGELGVGEEMGAFHLNIDIGEDEQVSIINGFMKCPTQFLMQNEKIIYIEAGNFHTILLTDKGRLFVAGSNINGQIGMPFQNEYCIDFTECDISLLDEDEYITKAKAGPCQTILLTNKNNLLVCGYNENGQLGLSKDMADIYEFKKSTINDLEDDEYIIQMEIVGKMGNEIYLLTNKGNIFASSDGFFERCVIKVLQLDEYITQMAAGKYHILLLTDENRLLVSGENIYGQLGLPLEIQGTNPFVECIINDLNKEESICSIHANGNHSFVRTNQNRVLGSGDNRSGQLGLPLEENLVYGFKECVQNLNLLKYPEPESCVSSGRYASLKS